MADWPDPTTPDEVRDALAAEDAELVKRKAEFCLSTGVSPTEYDAMTLAEIAIWRDTWARLNPPSR